MACLTPILFFGSSHTLWSAIDLAMRPLEPSDDVDPRWIPPPAPVQAAKLAVEAVSDAAPEASAASEEAAEGGSTRQVGVVVVADELHGSVDFIVRVRARSGTR